MVRQIIAGNRLSNNQFYHDTTIKLTNKNNIINKKINSSLNLCLVVAVFA